MGTTKVYRLVQVDEVLGGEASRRVLAEESDRERALAVFSDVLSEVGDGYDPWSQSRLVLEPAAAQS